MIHYPVLGEVVQKYLCFKRNMVVVDATLGLGGHAEDVLKCIGVKGRLIAFEQDERNLKVARERLKSYEKQIIYLHDNFRHLKTRIIGLGIAEIDAVFFDLGISSPHVDDPKRGFSFLKEGPLDMRFDVRNRLTAEIVINEYSESDLVRIFRLYGEEKYAIKLAKLICGRRSEIHFKTTTDLANFIEEGYPRKELRRMKIHPATKVFQALRIEVNDELNALKDALFQAFDLLASGGRIVVISYHSLEDRLVKKFFLNLEKPEPGETEKLYQVYGNPLVARLTKKPIVPSFEEISKNPRSRSAKLRAYEKL